jgi:hypothetical protein
MKYNRYRRFSTYVTKSVDVEVEIDLDDVMEFIDNGGTEVTETILSHIKPINDSIFEIKTLEDQLKLEVINSIWDKYTSFQLEEMFK